MDNDFFVGLTGVGFATFLLYDIIFSSNIGYIREKLNKETKQSQDTEMFVRYYFYTLETPPFYGPFTMLARHRLNKDYTNVLRANNLTRKDIVDIIDERFGTVTREF